MAAEILSMKWEQLEALKKKLTADIQALEISIGLNQAIPGLVSVRRMELADRKHQLAEVELTMRRRISLLSAS